MNVLILGGFLGSGKTSVLLQLAKYLIDISPGTETDIKVVIVENEIGAAGVDNLLLESADFTVENLFAGCACCTSSGQLTETVAAIKQNYNPKWIVIEATGLAYPDAIKHVVETNLQTKASVITIVDSHRWKRLLMAMEHFVTGQLKDAEAVLINKVDLVSEETVEEIKNSILKYNAKATCIPVSAVKELSYDFWDNLFKGMVK